MFASTSALDDQLTTQTVDHLRALLRLDTTNPPGNESLAARYLAEVLGAAGIAAEVLESAPGRGNLVARLHASEPREPALLLHGHLDVVPAREADGWTHPPFSGDLDQGYIWGRGALDHKATIAMSLAAIVALHHSGAQLRRDIIFAATADEEAGGFAGAGWLVDRHPELIDAMYCIGEGGGYGSFIGSQRIYPCSIAEKGSCRVHVVARGPAGHGAMPTPENAILRLAEVLRRLSRPLPYHHVTAVEHFLDGVASLGGRAQRAMLGGLAQSGRGERVVAFAAAHGGPALRSLSRQINPMLRNTVSPTILEAGIGTNVIPAQAAATLDGRYLPGQTAESFLAELRTALGPRLARHVTIEGDHVTPAVEMPWASPLAETITAVVGAHERGAPVLPFMLTAVTDAKHITRLPSLRHYYGFNPLRAPRDFPLLEQLHAVDERIPVEGLGFGVHVLADILREFCTRT